MKVLVYMIGTNKLPEELREQILRRVEAKAQVIFTEDHECAMQEIVDTDILFGYITPQMFNNAVKLRWLQAPLSSFGIKTGEYYIFPELAESKVTLTSMAGIYSDVIATHVFAFITAFARRLPEAIHNQGLHLWQRHGKGINLYGKTLGIIGLGSVGKEVARIGAAFHMKIIAVEPKPQNVPPFVEKVWEPEELKNMLREADFVVLCLPDAPGTVNIIGAEQLKAMKKTVYIVNIGRGRTMDLNALTEALKRGKIAGAGLDVFPPGYEPLPPDHPLWAMENVIITPHCAADATPFERRIDVFLENFDRYVQGKELLNLIDKNRMVLMGPGYRLNL